MAHHTVAIGIDFGTTNTRVAVYKDGAIVVIPNEYGNRSTPSCVTFTNTQHLIGESALNAAISNTTNTVCCVKHLIGRKFNDFEIKSYIRGLPYGVLDNNGQIVISVKYGDTRRTFEPEEVTSMILNKIKDISQTYLGVAVENVVITVPAHFNDSQCQAVMQAASIANLRVLNIMDETTAGIFAFGLPCNGSHEQNVLIFHLGGCTCNVTITTISKNSDHIIKASTISKILGVNGFTIRLTEYFIRDFVNRYRTKITKDDTINLQLRRAAEKAIIDLSSFNEATASVKLKRDGKQYPIAITRAIFEELCSDLFDKMKTFMQNTLISVRMQSSDIDQVILMGGGTKLLKIQNMMIEQFNGRILTTANPDETVVYGAAIQAALLSPNSIENILDLFLVNVVPLSLGVEICKGIMLVVVERNTPMPCTNINVVTTYEDNQTELPINIYEGERTLTMDNNFLGTLILTGIAPAPRGVAKINVVLNVSASGILFVQAIDQTSGSSQDMIIPKTKRLSSLEIRRNITESQLLSDSDRERKDYLKARDELDSFVYRVTRQVADDTSVLTKTEKELMRSNFEDVINWLNENIYCTKEDIDWKYTELSYNWSTQINKLNYFICSTSGNEQYQNVTSQPGPSGMQQQHEPPEWSEWRI